MHLEHLKGVSTIKFTAQEKCTGCGMCVEVCPHNVFMIQNKKAVIVNKDWCMECGACSKNCPVSIIEVNSGVGCAAALIYGIINRTEPQCGCSCDDKKGSKCC